MDSFYDSSSVLLVVEGEKRRKERFELTVIRVYYVILLDIL